MVMKQAQLLYEKCNYDITKTMKYPGAERENEGAVFYSKTLAPDAKM